MKSIIFLALSLMIVPFCTAHAASGCPDGYKPDSSRFFCIPSDDGNAA